MADEVEVEEAAPEVEPEVTPEDTRSAKERRRRERLQGENRELAAWKAEREANDLKAEEERSRQAGDFSTLEARLRAEIKGLTEENEGLAKSKAQGAEDKRAEKFLDAVVKAGGVNNRLVAKAMMPELGLEDIAPEDFTPREAKAAAKALREAAPQLFGGPQGDTPPPPGGGKPSMDPDSDAFYAAKAKAFSTQEMDDAYARATGRTTNTS